MIDSNVCVKWSLANEGNALNAVDGAGCRTTSWPVRRGESDSDCKGFLINSQ